MPLRAYMTAPARGEMRLLQGMPRENCMPQTLPTRHEYALRGVITPELVRDEISPDMPSYPPISTMQRQSPDSTFKIYILDSSMVRAYNARS